MLTSAPDELKLIDYDRLLCLSTTPGPALLAPINRIQRSSGEYDKSRSAAAFRRGAALRRAGKNFEEMIEALRTDPETAAWVREKGEANDERELRRIWQKAGATTTQDRHGT